MRLYLSFGIGVLAAVLSPVSSWAQSPAGFGSGEVEVVIEETAKESGDGSGEYSLRTTLKDDAVDAEIVHELSKVRTVMMENERDESMLVKKGGDEVATAGSDPAELGPWTDVAIDWLIPFAVAWDPERKENYRPRENEVRDAVHAAVSEASVRTRAKSDGRTTATVSIKETLPVDRLAEIVVEIREEIEDAEFALAGMRISATVTAPEGDPDVRGDEVTAP